jgi:hypothetical protein
MSGLIGSCCKRDFTHRFVGASRGECHGAETKLCIATLLLTFDEQLMNEDEDFVHQDEPNACQ